VLRRANRRADARLPLAQGLPLTQGLQLAHSRGATVLESTAGTELAASGARVRRPDPLIG